MMMMTLLDLKYKNGEEKGEEKGEGEEGEHGEEGEEGKRGVENPPIIHQSTAQPFVSRN